MGKKKKKIDVSGTDGQSFGNDAFANLSVDFELPADPKTIHESKASRQEKKDAKKRLIRLDVKREKSGRGGKTVSVVYGTNKVPLHERKDILGSLKKKFATGGTLNHETIEIQGDFVEPIVEKLNQLGYRAIKAGG